MPRGFEARIDRAGSFERANEPAGSDDEQDAESNLTDDEGAPQPVRLATFHPFTRHSSGPTVPRPAEEVKRRIQTTAVGVP
jgi:hypothetical protein